MEELANLIHVAGCAAFRLLVETKDEEANEIGDVLFALAGAIKRKDRDLFKALHRPALEALSAQQIAIETAARDERPIISVKDWCALALPPGSRPSGTDPLFRAPGHIDRLGRYLIEVVTGWDRDSSVPDFVDHVIMLCFRGQFESLDREQVRERLLARFKCWPLSDKPQENAIGVATVLCGGDAKKARNMIVSAGAMRKKRRDANRSRRG